MITRVKIKNKSGAWIDVSLYGAATFDERLDEQLDTGSIQLITDSEDTTFNDFCSVLVTITDDGGVEKNMYFCGFDTVERRGVGYYIHTLELVEPTRLLMGAIIEGKKVTQSITESEKKTLFQVAEGLLNTCELYDGVVSSPRFILSGGAKITNILSVVSPEFHWEAGTLLWECLLDIGNVVNAMPRLAMNSSGDFFDTITFDLINEEIKEYEL